MQSYAKQLAPFSLRLDDSAAQQPTLRDLPAVCVGNWGKKVRLACSYWRFNAFTHDLHRALQRVTPPRPRLIFGGSGDFHHVSLALLHQLPEEPINLLVLDKHPD